MDISKKMEEETQKHRKILDALNMSLHMYEKDAYNDRQRTYRNAEVSFSNGGNVDNINEYLDSRANMGADSDIERIKKEIEEENQRFKSVIEPLQAQAEKERIAIEKAMQEQAKKEEEERNKRKRRLQVQAEMERQAELKRQEERRKFEEENSRKREALKQEQEHQAFLQVIREKGLKDAGSTITSNPIYVMEAVRANGMNLQYASPELRNDPSIVSEAVRSNGFALQFASPQLKSDKWTVLDAVEKNGEAIKFASPELQQDTEIAMEAAKNTGKALEYISPEMQSEHPEIVVTAIKDGSSALVKPHDIFMSIDKDLRENNPEILEAYVNHPRTKKMLEYNLHHGEREEFINAQNRLKQLTETPQSKGNSDLFATAFKVSTKEQPSNEMFAELKDAAGIQHLDQETPQIQPTEDVQINYFEERPIQKSITDFSTLTDEELTMQQALLQQEIAKRTANIEKQQSNGMRY